MRIKPYAVIVVNYFFFLIWMNTSWQIIIYGAELTYGFQNVEKYNSHDWDS